MGPPRITFLGSSVNPPNTPLRSAKTVPILTHVLTGSLTQEPVIVIALSISATTNHTAELAMKKLTELKGCEVHMTHIPTPGDEVGLKRLGVNLTTDGKFSSRNLFQQDGCS